MAWPHSVSSQKASAISSTGTSKSVAPCSGKGYHRFGSKQHKIGLSNPLQPMAFLQTQIRLHLELCCCSRLIAARLLQRRQPLSFPQVLSCISQLPCTDTSKQLRVPPAWQIIATPQRHAVASWTTHAAVRSPFGVVTSCRNDAASLRTGHSKPRCDWKKGSA